MQRRDFMKTIGASALLSSVVANAAPAKKKIGIQLYTVRDAIGKELVKTLESVAKVGYKEVELAGYGDGKFYGKQISEFKKILTDLGLSVPSGHYTTGAHDKNLKGTLNNDWERAMANAAELGQKYAVCAYLFPQERTKLDDYKAHADLFNKSAEVAKKNGLQFCYHNHDFEFMPLDGQLPYDLLLANTDKNLVKMELDLYWITKAGQDAVTYFKNNPGRFPLWHIKDMDKTDQTFAEVGTGSIDFKKIFAHKKTAGLMHYFVEQDVCKRPPLEAIEISFKNLNAMKI
jgi:sugar phosphate isomerase/epimerase